MSEVFEKIKELAAIPTVSGNEKTAFEYIKKSLSGNVDEIRTDVIGNIIAVKKSKTENAKKLLLCCPVDTAGFIATNVRDDGKVDMRAMGFSDFSGLRGRRISFSCGLCGIVESDKTSDLSQDDFYAYFGFSDKDGLCGRIAPGDAGYVYDEPVLLGDKVATYGMGEKVLCTSLLDIAKSGLVSDYDVYYVFSAQNIPGARGIVDAVYAIRPDKAITLELFPSCSCESGVIIALRDASGFASPEMTEGMKNACLDVGVKYALCAETDKNKKPSTAIISASGSGCPTGICGIACERSSRIIDLRDMAALCAALSAYIGS